MKNKFILNCLMTGLSSFLIVYLGFNSNDFLIPWIMFLGMTSFYLSENNIKKSILSNLLGCYIGLSCILIGGNNALSSSLITGILATLIIVLTQLKTFNNSAITFIGGATAFAFNGNMPPIIYSFILGNIIAYLSVLIPNKIIKEKE